jgi:hypothetical protein
VGHISSQKQTSGGMTGDKNKTERRTLRHFITAPIFKGYFIRKGYTWFLLVMLVQFNKTKLNVWVYGRSSTYIILKYSKSNI